MRKTKKETCMDDHDERERERERCLKLERTRIKRHILYLDPDQLGIKHVLSHTHES